VRRTPIRAVAAAATTLAAAAAFLTPAHAITDGVEDGDDHPMVGLMVAQDEKGTPLWRCTGTLVSPTLFVTAGHCTSDDAGGSAPHAEIFFGSHYDTNPDFIAAIESGDPTPCLANDETPRKNDDYRLPGYPCTGDVSGTPHTHPDYDPARFRMRDLGVVVLDRPYHLSEYASLPEVGAFDSWRSNTKQTFTSVGYGLQEAYPDAAAHKDVADKTRMRATTELISVNTPSTGDRSMVLTNNASTGGTCFGDSGGPNFVGDTLVIAGVTSYGKNPTCGGQGGIYRLDRAEDRAWLASFLAPGGKGGGKQR
jgi:hypothetical protein